MNVDNDLNDRRKRDHDDLQNEIAGRSTGRQRRFLPGDRSGSDVNGKRKASDGTLSALDLLLLTDPVYAALYRQVTDALTVAETETADAIDEAEAALASAKADLRDVLEKAARLPDGRHVFRDAQGRVWTEDGEVVDPDTAAGIQWRGDEPSREDYLTRKKVVEDWQATLDSLRDYQTDVLGRARDRLNDPNDPPSEDELRAILAKIRGGRPALENQIAAELAKDFDLPDDGPSAPSSREAPILDVPDLRTAFATGTATGGEHSRDLPKADLSIPKV